MPKRKSKKSTSRRISNVMRKGKELKAILFLFTMQMQLGIVDSLAAHVMHNKTIDEFIETLK